MALIESRPKKGQGVSDPASGWLSSVVGVEQFTGFESGGLIWVKLNDDWLLGVSFVWSKSKVLVMEDFVLVGDDFNSGDGEVLGVVLNNDLRVLNNEWDVLVDDELLKFVDGALFLAGHLEWDLDLGGVWNLVFLNVRNLDFNLVWPLVVDGHWEFLVNVVGLLCVLSDLNLLRNDIGDLLDDGVVNAFGDFKLGRDWFFVGDLVDHSVWNWGGDNVWDLVEDGVWHLSFSDIWDRLLDLEWHLSFDSVWDLNVYDDWYESLDIVSLLNVVSNSNLIWDAVSFNNWYLLGNLVLLFDVLSDDVCDLIS